MEPVQAPVQSPPLSTQVMEKMAADPRRMLHQLARELIRTSNRKLLLEFLQLRRAMR